jgi:5,10-methylenetetrahydromethanopterin reductase
VVELRIGSTISFSADSKRMIHEMEKGGIGSFWFYEIFMGYEAFARAGYLVALTSQARIGVGVVNSYSRHPAITAMGASFLANLSGGRATLVVGVGGDSWVGGMLGFEQPRPLKRFREFLETLQALFRGETVTLHSEAFQLNKVKLDPAPEHQIPIIVACEHEAMMRTAGELADGVYLEPSCCPTGYVRWAVQTVRDKRSQTKPFSVIANLPLEVTTDLQRARSSLKPMLAFHLSFPSEGRLYLEKAGFPASLAEKIGDASGIPELLKANRNPLESFETGAVNKAAEFVPDEFVDQCAVIGTPEACKDRLSELERAGVTDIAFSMRGNSAKNMGFVSELSRTQNS